MQPNPGSLGEIQIINNINKYNCFCFSTEENERQLQSEKSWTTCEVNATFIFNLKKILVHVAKLFVR